MENTLASIIRGIPGPLEQSITIGLTQHLEDRCAGRNVDPRRLLDQLEAATKLMIPTAEYDISDFEENQLLKDLDLLAGGNREAWGQLLHALDDRHSGLFARLKEVSPFKGEYLMFLDVTANAATLQAELDDELAQEFLRRADAHTFPGNCYAVVVPPEALDLMRFVDAVDDLPSTT